ncbi:hypothetical protein HELRODRAFT_168768 [Helobdella robusta]|uniref:Synaptogyrin n=1 Tax=Helobdella robusta TaxID=6412 RepID=T1F0Y0_HELRO|nr:hypothetical protein HELRODRAFT_168768 [Helobdella robusta]ESO08854.1 hypothetical protein HELRODRAFT_168768 [Helobdella robusta]
MNGGGAYGAGKATGMFDVIGFLKKPQVILRFFSIIVFGCISSQAWENDVCRYNGDSNACGFGTTVGVLAFLGLLALLGIDFYFENLSSVQHRKYAVMFDMGFSGLWTFLYFVNFCYLADTWRRTEVDKSDWGESGVEAAVVFSVFSVATFAGNTVLAVMKYRKGVSEPFSAGYDPEVLGSTKQPQQQQPPQQQSAMPQNPFPPSYPQQGQVDPFRPNPFSNPDQRPMGGGDFQPVTY